MFYHYGRNETSFVCAMRIDSKEFARITEDGRAVVNQDRFPRYIEENEFILLMERDDGMPPTGSELVLFAEFVTNNIIIFQVVTENPDVFWKKQTSEA